MSPLENNVPLTVRSELIIDGADERPVRLALGADAAAGIATSEVSRFLLENMTACLDEFARIPRDVGHQHFVVDMGACAAPGRSEFSNGRAFFHFGADPDNDR